MSYAVDWTGEALASLTDIWIQAADRPAVSAAQEIIDRLLTTDPTGNSVHVAEGLFAIEVYPLRAQLEISEQERLVTVVSCGSLFKV
jgi:hypothetical protein